MLFLSRHVKWPKIYKWIKVLATYLDGFDTPTSSYTCNPGMAHIQLSSAPPKGFYYPKGTTPSFIPLPKTGPGTWMNQSSVTHYLPSQKIGRDTWMATWRTRDFSLQWWKGRKGQSLLLNNRTDLDMHCFSFHTFMSSLTAVLFAPFLSLAFWLSHKISASDGPCVVYERTRRL